MVHIIDESDYLAHYGILRKSGRYPYGSGGPEYASNTGFLSYVNDLKRQGISEGDIARGLGTSIASLRSAKSIAKNEEKAALIARVQRMREHGMSNTAIGAELKVNESSVRALLAPGAADRAKILNATSDMLKTQVDAKGLVDIGSGVEQHLALSSTRLDTAVALLKEQGYVTHVVQVDQFGTSGNKTNIKVLALPGTTYRDIASNLEGIKSLDLVTSDGGRTYTEKIHAPVAVNPARVKVNYKEDGGSNADGVIYLRPGVADLDLGGARYAQVRISVGDKHYLKGMAMYKDDLPEGTDLLFNTNKSRDKLGDNKLEAMKKMEPDKVTGKIDYENPYAATISRQAGVLNIVNEEGSWDGWSRNFSTQMLSKQSPVLAQQQLDLTYENKKADLADIRQLTNPQVRKKLLDTYADSADSSAVHLKAVSLPRSASHVILPFNTLKETEIYAPNYNDGDRVALVRYPHGGKFEIPELIVNNRHAPAKRAIGPAKDAVGINAKVAERLSGADFDGDTVLVILNNKGQIKSDPALQALKNFDPQSAYPKYEGMKVMSPRTKAIEMGKVSNLITDMTIMGATSDELARAVKHSMVVIDGEKHKLNYRQSAIDNSITALTRRYQGPTGGAATLISRATSPTKVEARKRRVLVDASNGKKIYIPTNESWIDKNGTQRFKTQESQKLQEAINAFDLVSTAGTKIESIYASHSNRMKALADDARKISVNTRTVPYSPSARIAYAPEVASLSAKLNLALRNRPLERQAQLFANTAVRRKLESTPDMDKAEIKKMKGNELKRARERAGAGKTSIVMTDKEWAAVQAGAVTITRLNDILDNADLDQVRQLAMPRVTVGLSPAREARARSMIALGYNQADIATALGISTTTIKELS